MDITTKKEVLEFDLINKYILFFDYIDESNTMPNPQKLEIGDDIIEKFLASVGSFWHNEKDQLEIFVYFNTGEYLCQRKKLKYNFTTKTNSWETYNFRGANESQCKHLLDAIEALRVVNTQIKSLDVLKRVEKIEEKNLFFQRRYAKKKLQRNMMLSDSDWRVLPDIEEKYEGEKQMWIEWRKQLRDNTIKSPEEFSTNLEFVKYIHDIKFPIDPEVYRNKYPNNEVGYLETEDQWVRTDAEASVDFINNRIMSILNHNKDYINQYQEVKKEVYDIIKSMDVHEANPDFDITKFVIEGDN